MSAENATYAALSSLSPYVRTDRYSTPKEDHKTLVRHLRRERADAGSQELLDVGCGNGELIYAISRAFPTWTLRGVDMTSEFIETARSFDGLNDVAFWCEDLFDVTATADIICCTGVANVFEDIGPLLDKLLTLCRAGGVILIDGLFNKHDVDVRVQFRDRSCESSRDLWRCSFNQHCRSGIERVLEGRVTSLSFDDMVMGIDLPRDPQKPHVDAYSFRDANDRVVLTNGLNLILNRTLLTIRV